jgi:15-cis-phytoene synthase
MTSLAPLYQCAREATASGSKSFYFATRFFPQRVAAAAHAVYWFCRCTDDLVDECANPEQGRRDLNAWEAALSDCIKHGPNGTHPPALLIFLDTVHRYQIPLDYAFELIEGMRMDLDQTRYRTFEELRVFCYRVASVVGLMMCSVIGFENPAARAMALPHAIDLGIAMQLTNILRDVGEDLSRGRIYLPLDEMRQFGYSIDDLRAKVRNEAFANLMRFQVARARNFYARGNLGIAMLHRDGRFAVEIASNVYQKILNRLEVSSFDVFAHRAVVPAHQKYWITAKCLARPLARQSADRMRFWRDS